MSGRSAHHATFTIERGYPAAPAAVFAAFAEPARKAIWFAGPDDWRHGPHELDFRIGGREQVSGGPADGPTHTFQGVYLDIVPDQRIVFAYDMHLGEARMSVSLVTVELEPEAAGTRLRYTEQATFLDGHDIPAQREAGTRDLLDALGAILTPEPAGA